MRFSLEKFIVWKGSAGNAKGHGGMLAGNPIPTGRTDCERQERGVLYASPESMENFEYAERSSVERIASRDNNSKDEI